MKSVFRDIDAKLAAFQLELATVRERGGSAVRADEFGWWRCSFRSTCEPRPTVRLKARSSAELLAALEARPDRPGARKQLELAAVTAEDACAAKRKAVGT